MAGGHPQHGGLNGVPLLDIGQDGGTRANAGTARFTGKVIKSPERARLVVHQLAQLSAAFVDNLGYEPGVVIWRGTIKAATAQALRDIHRDVNTRVHGSTRLTSGVLTTPDAVLVRATKLTDYDGTVLTNRAVLFEWNVAGERLYTPDGKLIQRVELTFGVLG